MVRSIVCVYNMHTVLERDASVLYIASSVNNISKTVQRLVNKYLKPKSNLTNTFKY